MASLKATVRRSQKKADGKCNIKIRLCHKSWGNRSKVTYFATPYDVDPKFMLRSGHLSPKYPGYASLTRQINVLLNEYQTALEKIDVIQLETMSISTLAKYLSRNKGSGYGLIKFMEKQKADLIGAGRGASAKITGRTIDIIKEFTGKDDIPFTDIDAEWISQYVEWLAGKYSTPKYTFSFLIGTIFNLHKNKSHS